MYKAALEALRTSIRTATSSMTSVPKPLKFLRPHYPALVQVYSHWAPCENRALLSDILSVLGMTYAEEGKRDCLSFRLSGSSEPIGSWGHEYVRHLSSEIIEEYNHRLESEESVNHLNDLATQVVTFFMKHNAEADACDLLLEMECPEKLLEYVDENTYKRVCLYILG